MSRILSTLLVSALAWGGVSALASAQLAHAEDVSAVEVWFDRDDYNDPNKIQEIEAYIRSAARDVCTPDDNAPRVSASEINRCTELAELQALALFHARREAHLNSERELLSTVEMDEEAGTASVEVWFDRAALNDPNEMARVENQIREAAAQVCAPEGNYRRVSERTSHARCTRLATAQALAVLEARADAVQNDQRELLPRQND